MSNIIKFEVETDANYDDEETQELLDAALAFFKGVDADVVDGTESIEIVDSNVISGEDDKVLAKAKELIQNGILKLNVSLDIEDESLFETGDVLLAVDAQ